MRRMKRWPFSWRALASFEIRALAVIAGIDNRMANAATAGDCSLHAIPIWALIRRGDLLSYDVPMLRSLNGATL